MKKSRTFLIAISILLLLPAILYAEIYKCIDDNNKVTFRTKSGPGCTLLSGSTDADQSAPKQKSALTHQRLPSKEHKERRVALLIGNSDYKHGGSLNNPVNDVRAIKRALVSLGFTVMKYENCTQREMKMAMDKFGSRLKGQDVGLFFYSGHGVQVSRYNYLIPVDAKLRNEKKVEYNCVRADRILAEMEIAGSRTNIVILDACRDNPFERSWRRGTEGTGLAFMNAPAGSLIAYSTAPGTTALDGRGKNSPYTSALLQHIKTPNITVLEMFQGVRSTVIARTGGKQTPWESTSLRGTFYFNDDKGIAEKYHKEDSSPTETTDRLDAVPSDLKQRIESLWKNNKIDEAMRVLNKTIESDPNNAVAYRLRGFMMHVIKLKHAKAVQDYSKAIELNPNDAENYSMRAWVYKSLNQYAKAIQDYDKVIELDPDNAKHYSARGSAHKKLKQYSRAIRDYDKAIELKPDYAWVYRAKADVYNRLKQYTRASQEYNKAVQVYSKIIELDPNNAKHYFSRGYTYEYFLKQYSMAIEDYNKVLELDPNNADYYISRGGAYEKLKQYSRAIRDYDKAIELDPDNAVGYGARGSAYKELTQYGRAIVDYDKAIALDPDDAWFYEERGLLYIKLQQFSKGCADLKKGCSLDGSCYLWESRIEEGQCF